MGRLGFWMEYIYSNLEETDDTIFWMEYIYSILEETDDTIFWMG